MELVFLSMLMVWALVFVVAVVLFLALRNSRRVQKVATDSANLQRIATPDGDIVLPENLRRRFMFWGGGLSGIVSAAVTHQLDVLKTRRHVGLPAPSSLAECMHGLVMGSFAQGERFAVTLVLNATLQARLDTWEKKAAKKGGRWSKCCSFLLSMVAAGTAEFLSNPPVVVKNYQIAHATDFPTAISELYEEGGAGRFFSGVAMGVIRKSLANAIVLQTVGPTKVVLMGLSPSWLGGSDPSSKSALGFIAGSITGSIAEVLTNHPDQVKTLTQTEGLSMWEAVVRATKNPFRGAGFAGLRKGAIRGINWGGLALFMAVMERSYRARQRKTLDDVEKRGSWGAHGA